MQSIFRISATVAAIVLVIVIVGGCASTGATTITYSYEPRFILPESKTYQWSNARPTHRQDSLLEANVRFLADRELEAKGLTSRTDKAALLVWMGYEFDPDIYGHGSELRALTGFTRRLHVSGRCARRTSIFASFGSSNRQQLKERNVSEISKETGVIAVLAKRMVEERLPKALALKERIDNGEVLNELDLNFLEQVVTDANTIKPMMRNDPRVLEVAGRMMELYKEITEKALANEQARTDGKK